MRSLFLCCFLGLITFAVSAQTGITRFHYHDAEKKSLKEVYQVRDTIQNILHGKYISYFLNGNVESKGQFANNETTGVWEFFYETGNLKMRGILRQNSNYGLWEYYYENGTKSMEGNIDGKYREGEWKIYYESGELRDIGNYSANRREGLWKTYFEDGKLRGEIVYTADNGRYTEYYHSGKMLAEGPRAGVRNVGHWKYYAEEGFLQSEGDYINGRKSGPWKNYYASGRISAEGNYENDEPVGKWSYYFEDGTLSMSGNYEAGKRNGYWNSFHPNGLKRSEANYRNGSGEYREFYPSGKLKATGNILDGKDHGHWKYFYEDGKLEGECDFIEGKGTYTGYYPNGTVQTKGRIEESLRVGTWELYEQDGSLSGYYKPFYEDKELSKEINSLINRSKTPTPVINRAARKGFYYFKPRFPEYHGVIIQGNPMMAFVGSLPASIEFYNQGRLGHEFGFEAVRNPFFAQDLSMPPNKIYDRGYAITVRQKFYNPVKTGMWYFAHEIRFVNVGHFANVEVPQIPLSIITASASEQSIQYGVQLGGRLMQRNNGDGFTIDGFIGYSAGYRGVDVEPMFENTFLSLRKNNFVQTFRFGLNFGYSFSFDGRR